MEYGIRQFKDGELSRVVRRASLGEETVATHHGRPLAKIVPYAPPQLPCAVAELVSSGRMELRIPILEGISPVRRAPGGKSAVEYVKDQRR